MNIILVESGILAGAEYDEKSGNHLRTDLAPGTAQWMRDNEQRIRSLLFTCPCGCHKIRVVPVKLTGDAAVQGAWAWDGNEATPTLRPSIFIQEGCMWHGWLTAGKWSRC